MKLFAVIVTSILMCNGKVIEKKPVESDVGFPEHERIDVDRSNTRVPLYIPGKCPVNQLLYPGDQKTDWICDCGPGFVYYLPKDACFAAYRQGPCEKNQMLVLRKGEFRPECVLNECNEDSYVLFEKKCYQLNQPGEPCQPVVEGGGIFGVNSTTLELECLKGTDRLSLLNFPVRCPPGSQRDRANQCRQTHEN